LIDGAGIGLLSRGYAANVIASEAKQSSIANRINKGSIFVEEYQLLSTIWTVTG
jgi:hypothetical protein